MINCNNHGITEIVLASPDLSENNFEDLEIIEYEYVYGGEIVESFYASKKFVVHNHLPELNTLPLPETYPHWFYKLKPYCARCLKAI